MKATFFLSLFLLFFCTTTLLPQSACPDQQQKWYMNYYEVDFTSGTPVISPTPYAPPPPSTGTGQLFMNVANGFHDTAGNLLLYTVWKYTNQYVEHYDIYNGIGVQIGNILSVQGYSREMEIIPFECSGNNYFLIVYVSQNFNTSGGNSLAYVIVDIANSLVSSPYFFDDAGNSGYIPTFAVSQKHLDGTFDLYSNIKKEVKKYIIDFSQCQISHEDIIRADLFNPIFYTDNQNIETSELELSPSGNKLTFAQRNSNVVTVIEIDANGNSSAPNQYLLLGGTPFQDRINGLEFNKDGTKLFVNYESSSTSDGVYVLDIASGIFGNVIPNTSDYARSQLEMGPDCYLYAGNYFEATDENRLARIDPSNESLVSSYLLPGRLPYQVANAQYNSGDGIFTLPDLIDCTGQACMNTAPPCTNRCLDFDGIDDYVQLPNSPVQGNGNFTIEAWFRNEDSDGGSGCSGNFERIFGCGGDRLEVGVCGSDLAIVVNSGSASLTNASPILNNQWYHMAITRSGNLVQLYLDCVKVYETTANFTLDNNFRIGRWSGGGGFDEVWEGKIDELRIWDYPRSQTQLASSKNCRFYGLEPGLIGYYTFDQGMPNGNNPSFNHLSDNTGNGNNGSLVNFALTGPESNWACSDILQVPCCDNRALRFDGVDDYIQLANSPVQGSGDFTIEAWFFSLDFDGQTGCDGNFERLIGCGGDRFEIGLCGSDLGIVVNSTSVLPTTATSIGLGWHHVAATRSGNLVRLYLDCVKVFETTTSFTLDNNFRIGRWPGGGGFDEVWTGFIDEVRIWDHARSLGEIATFKDCRLNGDEPGLVDYYPFDQGVPLGDNTSEAMLLDVTAQLNNGALLNFDLTGDTSNWACFGLNIGSACPPALAVFEKICGDSLDNFATNTKLYGDHIYVSGHRQAGSNFPHGTFSQFDLSGNLVWTVELDQASSLVDFTDLADGSGFLVVGRTEPVGTNPNFQDNMSVLARIDNSGTIVWARYYQQLAREAFTQIIRHPAPVNPNFPYYILGIENESSTPNTHDDLLLFNINADGNINWRRQFGDSNTDEEMEKVILPLPNGNIWLMGDYLEYNNPTYGAAMELDGNGVIQRVLSFNQSRIFYDAKTIANSSDLLVCGAINGGNAAFISRTDANLSSRWTRRFPNVSRFDWVDIDASGKVYALGYMTQNGLVKPALFCLTDNGSSAALNWVRWIENGETAFGNGCFRITPDDKILYVDSRKDNANGIFGWDMLLGVFDLDFNINCGMEITLTNDSLATSSNIIDLTEAVEIAPDPTTGNGGAINYVCHDPCAVSCSANFTWTVSDDCRLVQFTSTSEGTNLNWCWDFNGTPGCESTIANPQYLLDLGNNNVCLTIESPAGCSDTHCETITIQDNIPPVAICNSAITVAFGNNCLATITPANIDNGSFDNCDICSMTLSKTQFNGDQACQAIPVTLTMTDCAGNQSTCQSNVTASDTEQPVFNNCPQTITVSCDNIPAPPSVTATDNCFPNLIPAFEVIETTGCPYTITRKWTATDACGNSAQCVQLINVVDDMPPGINCPSNITVIEGSSTDPAQTGEATSVDVCDQSPVLTFVDMTAGTEPCPKTITRTWTATDDCGNTASCMQVISVECIGGDFCDTVTTSCLTDVLNIGTGFDHDTNGAYTSARYDAFWEIVETQANVSVPRPATVISPFLLANWGFQNGAEWLSFYEDYNLTENNEVPDPPHAFQRCFCLCSDADAVSFDFSVLVDDIADINLFDQSGALVANLMTLDNTTSPNFDNPPTPGSLTLPLTAGNYCIRADVRNTDQVAMGFNMKGSVSGGMFIKPTCCREGNIIYGVVYNDWDMEGFRDFRLNNNPPEPGLQGWMVTLCDLNNNPLFTTTTDQYGFYKFENVPAGSYILKETLMPSWSQTEPTSTTYNVTISNQQVVSNKNFGNFFVNAVDETGPFSNVSMFPNPTNSKILLSFNTALPDNFNLRLYDLWGRTIEEKTMQRGINQYTLDLSSLPSAVYIIEVKDEAGNAFRRKVLKQ